MDSGTAGARRRSREKGGRRRSREKGGSILDIGAVDDQTEQQADGIDKDVALAALDPLARIEAR